MHCPILGVTIEIKIDASIERKIEITIALERNAKRKRTSGSETERVINVDLKIKTKLTR